jgi:hypothetical protein
MCSRKGPYLMAGSEKEKGKAEPKWFFLGLRLVLAVINMS